MDAVYSLFGVVMHNGMSSCSGHYLSYVNVNVLRKADGERKVNDCGCPGGVQTEAVGELPMEIEAGCVEKKDECDSRGVTSNVTGQNGQTRGVKCGSCQRKAKVEDTQGYIPETNDKVGDSSCGDISRVCDKETSRQTSGAVDHGNLPREKSCAKEESGELRCDETMPMDTEDTCDHTDSVRYRVEQNSCPTEKDTSTDKSDKQINRRYPTRSSRADTMKKCHDSESSSDDEEPVNCSYIPRSMNITRYFKPIPKSESSGKRSRQRRNLSSGKACLPENSSPPANTRLNVDSLNREENQNDSRSQTTDPANDGQSTKRGLPKSQSSAFCRLETGTESSNRLTEEAEEDQERSSRIQRPDETELIKVHTDECSKPSSLKLMLDMEPSDELSETEEKVFGTSTDSVSNEIHTIAQTTTACGTHDNDSSTAKCSRLNLSANHMASHEGYTNHAFSKTNGCTRASSKKWSKYAHSTGSSQVDCVNTSVPGSTWLKFDDAEVQEISAKDMDKILSQSASCYSTPYLLFYYRC